MSSRRGQLIGDDATDRCAPPGSSRRTPKQNNVLKAYYPNHLFQIGVDPQRIDTVSPCVGRLILCCTNSEADSGKEGPQLLCRRPFTGLNVVTMMSLVFTVCILLVYCPPANRTKNLEIVMSLLFRVKFIHQSIERKRKRRPVVCGQLPCALTGAHPQVAPPCRPSLPLILKSTR